MAWSGHGWGGAEGATAGRSLGGLDPGRVRVSAALRALSLCFAVGGALSIWLCTSPAYGTFTPDRALNGAA